MEPLWKKSFQNGWGHCWRPFLSVFECVKENFSILSKIVCEQSVSSLRFRIFRTSNQIVTCNTQEIWHHYNCLPFHWVSAANESCRKFSDCIMPTFFFAFIQRCIILFQRGSLSTERQTAMHTSDVKLAYKKSFRGRWMHSNDYRTLIQTVLDRYRIWI